MYKYFKSEQNEYCIVQVQEAAVLVYGRMYSYSLMSLFIFRARGTESKYCSVDSFNSENIAERIKVEVLVHRSLGLELRGKERARR